jgi:hypothetical protein
MAEKTGRGGERAVTRASTAAMSVSVIEPNDRG